MFWWYLLYATGFAAYGLVAYACLVSFVQRCNGRLFVPVLCVWLCSALPIAFLAFTIERRTWWELVSFDRFAWSFLIGDSVVLPVLAVTAAYAWSPPVRGKRRKGVYAGLSVDRSRWYCSWWWPMACLVGGFLGALGFRWMEIGNYTRAGAASALVSPTKLMHDFVAFPVLLGAILCVCIPVVMYSTPVFRWVVVALVGLMLALMMADTLRGLDPKDLHPRGEWRRGVFVVNRA